MEDILLLKIVTVDVLLLRNCVFLLCLVTEELWIVPVYCYCVLLLCIVTVDVLLLRNCVLLLCIVTVYCYCGTYYYVVVFFSFFLSLANYKGYVFIGSLIRKKYRLT